MLNYIMTIKKPERLAILHESSLFGTSTWQSLAKKAKEKNNLGNDNYWDEVKKNKEEEDKKILK